MKTVITWWIAKSDSHMVHGRIQIYTGDTLVQTREIEPSQTPKEGETPMGLKLFGPSHFRFDIQHVPIDKAYKKFE